MSEELKQNRSVNAFLTLEPQLEPEAPEQPENPAALMEETPDMDPVQKEMARMELTSEEQKMVDSFAEKIDVENTAQILQYGAGTQKKMADFSDEALKNVRAQDLGEVGELLTDVVSQLKDFDTEEEKGLFGFFKKGKNKIELLRRGTPKWRPISRASARCWKATRYSF